MYKNLDDTELIYMIKENTDNYELMLEKYRPLILGICQKYIQAAKEGGYEFEDLMQIANIALFDAIKSYDSNYDVLFYTFLVRCIKNRLNNEIRYQKSNKKRTLNTAISYDEPIKGTNKTLLEIIPDKNAIEPLTSILDEQDEITYTNFLNSLPFEAALVYELKINGFSNFEIETFLQISMKDIVRNMNIARRKLAKLAKTYQFGSSN